MGLLDTLFGTKTTAAQNAGAGQAQQCTHALGGANEQMLRGLNVDGQTALNTGANIKTLLPQGEPLLNRHCEA